MDEQTLALLVQEDGVGTQLEEMLGADLADLIEDDEDEDEREICYCGDPDCEGDNDDDLYDDEDDGCYDDDDESYVEDLPHAVSWGGPPDGKN